MAPTSRDGDAPALATIERLIHAFNKRDIETFAAAFHPDSELWPADEYLPPGTSYHGRDGLLTMLREGLPGLPGVRADIVRMTPFGERVVVCLRVKFAGEERDLFWVYTFAGGLVRRAEQFPTEAAARAAGEGDARLTPRERQVFQLLARGFTGPEIAEQLVVSPETVRTHVQNGVERLGASTRVQAVAIAISRGEIAAV